MNRSQEREQAFIILFEKVFHPEIPEEELMTLAEETEFITATPFTRELVAKTLENLNTVDEEISRFAVGWSLGRMNKVSLAILRLAVAEILYFDDIPASVSINEAVELAKKYASQKDGSFINGILGSIAREQENS
ncbi:MAG: transcription antitermination factor NusB [Acutalibacteraceae bacterium]|jgi:N utilization substance protein B|nr:transcription antitermination factor NusB [Acutalibacteraceae bacterium]